jgi:hypothetical protein
LSRLKITSSRYLAWDNIPPHKRSIVRAYINSENEKDRERAHDLCRQYGLDYHLMRRVVLAGMIQESRKLGKSWKPAAGSRPQSTWEETPS